MELISFCNMTASPLNNQEGSSVTINCNGKLIDLSTPQVMGILNVTPDSFYSGSRKQTETEIIERAHSIVEEGGSMIDIGAYSSRPGAEDISNEEEMARLRKGLSLIRAEYPNAIISVDTFRSDVAKMCVEEYGVSIINDIAAGELDNEMFQTVAKLHVPYIMMHMKGNPRTMQDAPHYDNMMEEMMLYFSTKINQLHDLGETDIIIDPGFGFSKTLDHNYQLMAHLHEFQELGKPMLVGISRKSMIYRLNATTPEEALNGTTMLNTIALQKGANILRVHDVKECVEVVRMYKKLQEQN